MGELTNQIKQTITSLQKAMTDGYEIVRVANYFQQLKK